MRRTHVVGETTAAADVDAAGFATEVLERSPLSDRYRDELRRLLY